MGSDVVDCGIVEQPPNDFIGLAGLRERGLAHHPLAVEGPEGQDAAFEGRRDLVTIDGRLRRMFTDEDGMGCPIRVVAIVRYVIDQQKGFPDIA